MKPDWQLMVTLLIVAGAGWYLVVKVRAFWRQARTGKGCASSCGACSALEPGSEQAATVDLHVDLQLPHQDN